MLQADFRGSLPACLDPFMAEVISCQLGWRRHEWVSREVCIACRRDGLCDAEQLSDYREAEAYTSGYAREAMAKVMNTHVVETGASTDTAPRFLKVD